MKRCAPPGLMPVWLGSLAKCATTLFGRAVEIVSAWRTARSVTSSQFVTGSPSPQSAVGAVAVEWASRFPPPLAHIVAGDAELFDDERMHWGFERLGGLHDRSVLELGPLEGAHSYMAQQAGARQVIAVEANTQAYLKCLVVKELFELDRCSFLCGDVTDYLAGLSTNFDVCFACGILYHMTDPVRLIDLISRHAARLLMWTHYYDDRAISGTPTEEGFVGVERRVYKGFEHELHRHSYAGQRRRANFWGGNQTYSSWLSRQAILDALDYFGWGQVEMAFEDETPHGPAFALVGHRK